MRLVDVTVLMVGREQAVLVVCGKSHPKLGKEELGGSQVNVTVQVLVTMGEWVQVGLPRGMTD